MKSNDGPERAEFLGDEVVRAAIEAILDPKVIARRQETHERGGDRRHATCGHERCFGVLKRRQEHRQHERAPRVVAPSLPPSVAT